MSLEKQAERIDECWSPHKALCSRGSIEADIKTGVDAVSQFCTPAQMIYSEMRIELNHRLIDKAYENLCSWLPLDYCVKRKCTCGNWVLIIRCYGVDRISVVDKILSLERVLNKIPVIMW